MDEEKKVDELELPTDGLVGKRNNKIYEKLAKKVLESDLPGPDYLEFRQQLMNMQDLETDLDADKLEEFIFKAAYNVVRGGDKTLTKQILINSVNHYIKVVEEEEKSFWESFRSALKTRLNDNEETLNKLEKEKKEITKQIAELQERLVSLDAEKAKNLEEIELKKIELSQTKLDFDFSSNELKEKLHLDKEKIEKYIKN